MEEWIKKLPKIKGITKKELQKVYERYNPPKIKKKDKRIQYYVLPQIYKEIPKENSSH